MDGYLILNYSAEALFSQHISLLFILVDRCDSSRVKEKLMGQ